MFLILLRDTLQDVIEVRAEHTQEFETNKEHFKLRGGGGDQKS